MIALQPKAKLRNLQTLNSNSKMLNAKDRNSNKKEQCYYFSVSRNILQTSWFLPVDLPFVTSVSLFVFFII